MWQRYHASTVTALMVLLSMKSMGIDVMNCLLVDATPDKPPAKYWSSIRGVDPPSKSNWIPWRQMPASACLSDGASTESQSWRIETGGAVTASAVVGSQNIIYFGNSNDQDATTAADPVDVFALYPDGRALFEVGGIGSIKFAPCIGESAVYVGVTSSQQQLQRVYALHRTSGVQQWHVDTAGAVSTPLILSHTGLLYAGTAIGNLSAFDTAALGVSKWSHKFENALQSGPALSPDGSNVVVATSSGLLASLASDTGALAWSVQMDTSGSGSGSSGSTPSGIALDSDGDIFIALPGGRLERRDGGSGTVKVSTTLGNGVGVLLGTPAFAENGKIVLLGSDDGRLYARQTDTLDAAWELSTGGAVRSSVAVGGSGRAYFGAEDNEMHAVDTATGKLLWTFPMGGGVTASPALDADENIFVGSRSGRFVRLSCGQIAQSVRDVGRDPPGMSSTEIVGIVLGVLFGLLVTILFFYCICRTNYCHRNVDASTQNGLNLSLAADGGAAASSTDDVIHVDALPTDWDVAFDKETGEKFYWNKNTGLTSWERPTQHANDVIMSLPAVSLSPRLASTSQL